MSAAVVVQVQGRDQQVRHGRDRIIQSGAGILFIEILLDWAGGRRSPFWNLMEATGQTLPLELRQLLRMVATGEQPPAVAEAELARYLAASGQRPELHLDLERAKRCGHAEVIYAPGKAVETILAAFEQQQAAGQPCLATRCSEEQLRAITETFPQARVNPIAGTAQLPARGSRLQRQGRVVVVTAGASDRPVAEEACETLLWMQVDAELLMDVGVAGPQRFLQQKHRLDGADCVVVVAGMEGALPSVVAGWLACPVIAVPTSVGYGTSFQGLTALLGMLNSCAANVAVVNIDAGFKGGYLAGLIARQRRKEA